MTRVYPGDQITLGMHFGGNLKRMHEMREILAHDYPQFTFNLIDIYTMFPTVLWVQPPDVVQRPVSVVDGEIADES